MDFLVVLNISSRSSSSNSSFFFPFFLVDGASAVASACAEKKSVAVVASKSKSSCGFLPFLGGMAMWWRVWYFKVNKRLAAYYVASKLISKLVSIV